MALAATEGTEVLDQADQLQAGQVEGINGENGMEEKSGHLPILPPRADSRRSRTSKEEIVGKAGEGRGRRNSLRAGMGLGIRARRETMGRRGRSGKVRDSG